MKKRNWPDFYNEYKFYEGDTMSFIKNWLEANIPKEVLDKIAPPICENHEPDLYTSVFSPTGIGIEYKCKHCGAEIKPSGWILK